MANGRMRFYSIAQNAQTSISYVIPNDLPAIMTQDNPHFQREMKTLYLLHGISGNDCDWVYSGAAEELALQYNLAVICITAGNNFYLDREATGCKYATFAGEEVVTYTRKLFSLSDKREDTLIGGLSMGGYGAIHTALSYPDTFGGCIALSSALITKQIAAMKEGEGNEIANAAYYREIFGDPERILTSDIAPEFLYQSRKKDGRPIPPVYLACGTEDMLIENNRAFRDFLQGEQADFRYEEGPGIHDWKFWNVYIMKGAEWLLSHMSVRGGR